MHWSNFDSTLSMTDVDECSLCRTWTKFCLLTVHRRATASYTQGALSFSTLIFHDFSMTKKMKIHDLSAQHIFPSKWYTTYEYIPELVVTVPSARSTTAKKIKWFIIWLYKWSRDTFTELLSAVVKIPWHYHHFPWLSMTFAIFQDFPGLENGFPKFHDFPWPGGTLYTQHETTTYCAVNAIQLAVWSAFERTISLSLSVLKAIFQVNLG